MNVASTIPSSLAGGYGALLTGARTQGDETPAGGASAQAGAGSSASGQSCPALDAQKKIAAIQKGMVALMLIQDPAERAKAAARMYKQYASVAKEYAAATADGRAAAQKQSQANRQANAQTLAGQTPTDQTPTDQASTDQAADPAAAPTAQQATAIYAPAGAAPAFVPDLIMEQIKTFADAAKQAYDLAVQEAKVKKGDHSKLKGAADDMKDAKDVLDAAAKDVEGDPDGISSGYDAAGGGTTASAQPLFQATA